MLFLRLFYFQVPLSSGYLNYCYQESMLFHPQYLQITRLAGKTLALSVTFGDPLVIFPRSVDSEQLLSASKNPILKLHCVVSVLAQHSAVRCSFLSSFKSFSAKITGNL